MQLRRTPNAEVLVEITDVTPTSANCEYTIDWGDETSGTFTLLDGSTTVATLDVTSADLNAIVPIGGLTTGTEYTITFVGNISSVQTVATFITL